MAGSASTEPSQNPPDDEEGKFYTYVFEGEEFHTQDEEFTCGELMEKHGVDFDVGLIRIFDDGTEERCPPDQVIDFESPGRRFKEAPRFKRG